MKEGVICNQWSDAFYHSILGPSGRGLSVVSADYQCVDSGCELSLFSADKQCVDLRSLIHYVGNQYCFEVFIIVSIFGCFAARSSTIIALKRLSLCRR